MDRNYVRNQLCQSTTDLKRAFTKYLSEISLSFPQWNALKAIKHSDKPLSAKDLVEKLNSDKATISGVINRLSEANLIEVRQNPDDKRGTLLYLKDESKLICSQVMDLEERFNEKLFDNFSEDELNTFSELLKKLTL